MRRSALAALALVSCATAKAPVAAPSPSIAAVVHAADGSVLRDGEWKIMREAVIEPVRSGKLGPDGSFHADVPAGAYAVIIEAGDKSEFLHAYVDRPARVDVKIAAKRLDNVSQWSGLDPRTQALTAYHRRWFTALQRILSSAPKKDGRLPDLDAALEATIAKLAADARAEAGTDPLLRAAHLGVFWHNQPEAVIRADATWVTEHLAPDDPRLPLIEGLQIGLAYYDKDSRATEAWYDKVARTNPEPGAACEALSDLAWRAHARGDEARVQSLFEQSTAPRCKGTYSAKHMADAYDPARPLMPGKPFPAFDFAALEPGGPRVTKESRLGHPYVIEFWATWCAPCVKTLPALQEKYERLRAANPTLELVFVSLDEKPESVIELRKHYPMPWTHAFAGETLEKVGPRFGFSGVPTMVLVDAKGTIVRGGSDLHLADLEAAVAKLQRP